jgi:hypothetical protein
VSYAHDAASISDVCGCSHTVNCRAVQFEINVQGGSSVWVHINSTGASSRFTTYIDGFEASTVFSTPNTANVLEVVSGAW